MWHKYNSDHYEIWTFINLYNENLNFKILLLLLLVIDIFTVNVLREFKTVENGAWSPRVCFCVHPRYASFIKSNELPSHPIVARFAGRWSLIILCNFHLYLLHIQMDGISTLLFWFYTCCPLIPSFSSLKKETFCRKES